MNTDFQSEPSDSVVCNETFKSGQAFVGHTRFSVHQYGHGSFVATRKGKRGAGFSNDEYTEWLYSKERMRPRVEIFARIGVPQLSVAASDYNVIHYVSYSSSLPKEYKDALQALSDKNHFIRLNQVEDPIGPFPTAPMIKAALASLNLAEDSIVGVYRQDDDDVLAADYFSRMASYVKPEFSGFWVSLGLGVAALQSGDDLVYTREWYRPKVAIGLMHVVSPDSVREKGTLDRVNHRFIDFDAPTILDSREPGWFHVRHPGQDTNLSKAVDAFFPRNIRSISGRGVVKVEQMRKLFPALANRVYTSPGNPAKAKALVEQPQTFRGVTPKFRLNTVCPIAVSVIAESRNTFPNVKLHFTLHDPHAREETEIQRILRRQGVKYSAQSRSNFVSFLSEESSSEHVAVVELPWDIHVSEVWLASIELDAFDVERVTVYPLSGLS